MVRSYSMMGLIFSIFSTAAVAQEAPVAKSNSTSSYKLVKPLATATNFSSRKFSEPKQHIVIDMIALKDGRELVVSEGDHLDTGAIYKVDPKTGWRGARFENNLGICSIVSVPSRNEVISSSWDSTIRFHDVDSLGVKASISVDRSATRLAATPDGSTLAIINEGYLNADVSAGRTLWSVDIGTRSQKSILGGVPFRGFNIGYSPSGESLAICGGLFENRSGTTSIWDVAAEKQKVEIKVPTCLFKLGYTSDGKWLIATGGSGTITIDAQRGEQLATSSFIGRALHILPKNDAVLVADGGNTFALLSIPDLKTLKTLTSDAGTVGAFTSLEDGTSIVTGTRSGLQRWDRSNWTSKELIRGRIPVAYGFSPILLSRPNLIAVNRNKELLLCDAESGQVQNSHTFASNIIKTTADQNSNRIGVILENGTAYALDTLTGQIEKLGTVPAGSLPSLSQDLSAVLSVSPSGTLTRYQFKPQTLQTASTQLPSPITHLFTASDDQVCCGFESGEVIVFDARLKPLFQLPKAAESISCLNWSREDQRLAIADKNGNFTVLETNSSGIFQNSIQTTLNPTPTSFAISATSGLVAVGHSNGTVSLISPDDSSNVRVVPALAKQPITSIAFLNHDAGLVYSSGESGAMNRIKLNTQPITSTHRIEAKENQQIHSACISPKGDDCFIAVDNNIEVRSTETWEKKHTLRGHRGIVVRVRVTPDGQWLASTGQDALVIVRKRDENQWGIDSTVFLPARGHRIEFSPDGRWLLVGTDSRQICVIDAKTWQMAHTFDVPFVPNTFSFSADGRILVSSGINAGNPSDLCQVQVWDTTGWNKSEWNEPKTMQGHHHGVEAIAITEDNHKFYSVAADSELLEWSISTGTSKRIRYLPMSGTSFSFLPDPKYALTSWHFANLAVLDVNDGSIVLQTEGHVGDGNNVLMRDVVISQDGKWAISCAAADLGHGAGSARLWRIGTSKNSLK